MMVRKCTLGTATVMPTKQRRPGDTSPIGTAATQILRKYQQIQQQGRGSPLSATVTTHRLLLRKLGSEAASVSDAASGSDVANGSVSLSQAIESKVEASHFQCLRDFVKMEYPELRKVHRALIGYHIYRAWRSRLRHCTFLTSTGSVYF